MDLPPPAAARSHAARSLVVAAVRETALGEQRVALDPASTAQLTKAGTTVLLEAGAGTRAGFTDAAYTAAGARTCSRSEVLAACDVLAVVRPPDADLVAALRQGQLLIGMVDPLGSAPLMAQLADLGVTVAAFELLPRTLSRAQSMDAMSSQASAAGYRAGVLAAASLNRYLPMMITASGTARPTSAIVVGAGVAGLQALGTLRRLGAVVTGYDVRAASRGEVESVGATFLTSSIDTGAGAGGYARAMTPEEATRQQDELADRLVSFDIIITTAKVPGRTPPVLVTAGTLAALRPGSVCIDMAAGLRGGNVEGSIEGKRTLSDNGVIVIGGGNLASDLAGSASSMYARNVVALLGSLTSDGAVVIRADDEIHSAVVVCHDGALTHPPTSAADPRPAPPETASPIPALTGATL